MSDSKVLKRTLMDIRKMRRSVRMREESDPEVVAQTLETILKEAIALSSTSDGAMSKAAVKEIQQVRRALIAQQIDAGQNTAKYIGVYSAVLDSVEGATSEIKNESESSGDSSMSSFRDSMPSSDTIISAIMTANPIMGYTLKMTRDLMGTAKKRQKENKERTKKENTLRLERLKEQEKLLSEESEVNDIERENAEGDSGEVDSSSRSESAIYQEALEGIRSEIRELVKHLSGQSASLERTSDEAAETSDVLERIYEHDQDEASRLEAESAGEGLKRQESMFEGGDSSLSSADSGSLDIGNEGKGGSLLSGVIGKIAMSIGGLFGIGAGAVGGGGLIATLIAPFKHMFGFLKTSGKMLLKFGKFSGILSAVLVIYDFVKGFTDAANIAGKDESEVTFKDKINAGFSSILTGLLAPISWLSETLFGEGLMGGKSKDELTKQYFTFFDDFGANIVGMGGWILGMIVDKMTEIKDSLSDYLVDLMPDWAKSLLGIGDELTPEQKAQESEEEQKKREKLRKINDFRNGGKLKPLDPTLKPLGDKSELGGLRPLEQMSQATSSNVGDRVTTAMDKNSSETVQGSNRGGGGNSVFAPTSSNTNVTQKQYIGNESSENREVTHRRFSITNSRYGYGV